MNYSNQAQPSRRRRPPEVSDVRVACRRPTWREEALTFSYVLLTDDTDGKRMADIYRWAIAEGFANPRVVSPSLLEWSSLFHPRFFEAIACDRSSGSPLQEGIRQRRGSELELAEGKVRFWLQSVLFLAGVTMSAAIVQSRWSEGTVQSKYDRLWQAGYLAELGVIPELRKHALTKRVRELAADNNLPDVERLLRIRGLFEEAIDSLGTPVTARRVKMQPGEMPGGLEDRFGFVTELSQSIEALTAVIVYGSSVNSPAFADYDVIIVTEKPESALRALAGTSPVWKGKELNVGMYSPDELWHMQLLSGDNLADYGLCVFGAVDVPEKSVDTLLLRNMSFGIVRQRQQLGMIGPALSSVESDHDDRRNLYEYFVKIPANIAKGTFGAVGQRLPKEEIQQWLYELCGFNTTMEQARATSGDPGGALSNAAVATGRVLQALNQRFDIATAAGSDCLSGVPM